MSKNPIFNPDPSLYPDPSGRARRICKFISKLKLWEGDFAGKRFYVNPFQEAIIRRIYGPVDEDGNRLVRIANIWIPRGNAKTTLAAGLGLAHFLGPEAEAGGQVIMAAADRGNAGIAFNCGFQMIQQDDILLERIKPIVSLKELHHVSTASLFKAISTEAYSKHGLNVSFFLADEIHAWPPTEARKLWKVITDSMVKRSNPLTVVISTAGEGAGGLAWDMWDYSHRVAKDEINDPTFAPIIFEAEGGEEAEANWKNEEIWKQANPGIEAGFVSLKELRIKVARSEHFPTDAADFKRFHLNMWIEGAAQPWIELETYDKAEERRTEEDLLGKPCWVGIDLSSVEDLTAVVAVFPDEDEEERGFDIFPMFFLPEDNLKTKSDRDQANYVLWESQGFLTLTPGNRVDQRIVLNYILELKKKFDLREAAVDRWNSTAFVTSLLEEDIEAIEFGQGFMSMAGPVKEIKATILSGKFRHGKNPILRMCFANAVTEKDAADNEKFTKAKARGRIDGCIGAAEAIGRILVAEAEELDGIYRGAFSSQSKGQDREIKQKLLPEPELDDGTWSPEIISNVKHPLFTEHKKRFEAWQEKQVDRWDDF